MCRAVYWLVTYSGYAGDISPELAFELLSGKESAVLVDIRPEVRYCFSLAFSHDTKVINTMMMLFSVSVAKKQHKIANESKFI